MSPDAPAGAPAGAIDARVGAPSLPRVLLLAAVAFGVFMGLWPLQDPDEGRYTDIGHAMERDGDWLCSRLNGLRYQEKPPFFFALVGLSLEIFGENETAARLPSTLATLATIALVGLFARRRLRAGIAGLSALLLAAMPLFAFLGRFVLVDLTLTFFVTAATLLAHRAMRIGEPYGPLRRGATCAAWACAGAACLIKGPIGLALPLAGIVPFVLWERRFRQLAQWLRPEGPALFAAIVVPAYWLVEQANPGFLHSFVVGQNFGRLTSGEDFGRNHALWYYVPIFLVAFLPGSLRVVSIGRELFTADDGTRSTRRFLACAVVGPFVLLSLAHSMLAYYLLPLAPPFALLCADLLVRTDDGVRTNGHRGRGAGAIAYAAFGLLLALLAVTAIAARFVATERLLALIPQSVARKHDPAELALRVATFRTGAPALALSLAPLAFGLLVAARRRSRGEPLRAGVAAAYGMLGLIAIAPWTLREAAALITAKPCADWIRAHERPGERVFSFDFHLRGLPYYLQHDVLLWSASYAEFGHEIPLEEARPHALQKNQHELARLFAENKSLVVLMHGEDHLPDLRASTTMRFTELDRRGDLILLRGERK